MAFMDQHTSTSVFVRVVETEWTAFSLFTHKGQTKAIRRTCHLKGILSSLLNSTSSVQHCDYIRGKQY